MIIKESCLDVLDNSGAKIVKCIGHPGRFASVGDKITVAVQKVLPNGKIKKGAVHEAIIVTTRSKSRRRNGSVLDFDYNGVVLVNAGGDMLGTRVSKTVAIEIKKVAPKIVSLAPAAV